MKKILRLLVKIIYIIILIPIMIFTILVDLISIVIFSIIYCVYALYQFGFNYPVTRWRSFMHKTDMDEFLTVVTFKKIFTDKK